jgi:hypothetical protein
MIRFCENRPQMKRRIEKAKRIIQHSRCFTMSRTHRPASLSRYAHLLLFKTLRYFSAKRIVLGSLLCCVTVGFLFGISTYQESVTLADTAAILPTTRKIQLKKERAPEPIDICFVSSIFAPTIKTADRPHDMTSVKMENTTSFQFFMYTNLEDLESLGWTKVLRHFNYRRFITQSRWGKFMAWNDPEMEACQTIFYLDGHYNPGKRTPARVAQIAKKIRESEFGLAQMLHPTTSSAIGEFDNILRLKKDITKNVNASIDWLQAQPDFYDNCTVYHNAIFGKLITCVLLFKRC